MRLPPPLEEKQVIHGSSHRKAHQVARGPVDVLEPARGCPRRWTAASPAGMAHGSLASWLAGVLGSALGAPEPSPPVSASALAGKEQDRPHKSRARRLQGWNGCLQGRNGCLQGRNGCLQGRNGRLQGRNGCLQGRNAPPPSQLVARKGARTKPSRGPKPQEGRTLRCPRGSPCWICHSDRSQGAQDRWGLQAPLGQAHERSLPVARPPVEPQDAGAHAGSSCRSLPPCRTAPFASRLACCVGRRLASSAIRRARSCSRRRVPSMATASRAARSAAPTTRRASQPLHVVERARQATSRAVAPLGPPREERVERSALLHPPR